MKSWIVLDTPFRRLAVGIIVFLLPLIAWPWAARARMSGWQALGLRGYSVVRVQAEGSEGLSLIYAETEMGLWRTLDGGASWARIYGGWPRDRMGRSLLTAWEAAPTRGRVLYALASWGDNSTIYRSSDSGSTWLPGILLPARVDYMAVSPRNPDHVYVAGGQRYWASQDGGTTWRELSSPSAGDVTALAVGWDKPHVLYAATTDPALWLSENGGLIWTRAEGLPEDVWRAIVPAGDGRVLYLVGRHHICRSDDGGYRWRPLSFPLKASVTALVVDRLVAQEIYAVTVDGHIMHSIDGGKSWQLLWRGPVGSRVSSLSVSGADRTHIYAGTEAGVWIHPVSPQSPTPTPSLTPTPTYTLTPTPSPTPMPTVTPTMTPTPTVTPTPTPILVIVPSPTTIAPESPQELSPTPGATREEPSARPKAAPEVKTRHHSKRKPRPPTPTPVLFATPTSAPTPTPLPTPEPR